ncbi:MAG: hypothetical protein ACREQ2_24410 [Candidatus Binatia bacterium]
MAFPSFDTATSLWAPQASISWVVGTERKSEFVRFAKRVFTEAEAAACALSAGKSWVDARIKRAGDVASFEREQDSISSQPTDVRFFGNRTDSRREGVRDSRTSKKMLTFDQFKSWVDQSNPNVSEQLLQKSYAALVQLRKHQHCSWAHIMVKMKNSRAQIAASARSAKSSHLPLTLRDWRRII